MSLIRNFRTGPAALSLAGLCLAGLPPAPAQAQAFDITGVWRDENAQADDKTTPSKLTLGAQPSFNDNFHGSYRSRPYLLITRQDSSKPTGPYFLYSDVGDLRAELRPVGSAGTDLSIIDRRTGNTIGLLQTRHPACEGVSPCFVLSHATAGLTVPTGNGDLPALYVPVGRYDPRQDPKLDQTFGNMFSPLSANFAYILKCWHMARMDDSNYQVPGCGKDVFSMPSPDSYGYSKVGFNNWHNGAVPFGWTYVSTQFQNGEDRGRTWETGQDLAAADKLKVGVSASVNVFGVTASTHVSVGTQSKVENMYNSKLTYSKAEYLITQFAFVLNKYYAALDPDLKARIQRIRDLPDADRASEYERFVTDYGTHYANAITFGAKGERQLRMSQSQVMAMNESQTDVSVGITAGYMGNGGGVDVDTSKQNMQKITNGTSSEDRNWFCYSGGTCNEGIPSGDSALPVQLDLRPISELLAPPFFADDVVITTLRDGVNREVARQAFVKRDGLQLPSAVFATVTGFKRYNITGFAPDLQNLRFDNQACGARSTCNDGTATLTASDGSLTQIPADVSQPPQWRIPATLDVNSVAPRVLVNARYTWSGRCLSGTGTWSTASGASAEVSLPTLAIPPAAPGTFSGGVSIANSPNCATASNPMGAVTLLTSDSIVKVESAKTLLGSP
jgi:hypothetical protein